MTLRDIKRLLQGHSASKLQSKIETQAELGDGSFFLPEHQRGLAGYRTDVVGVCENPTNSLEYFAHTRLTEPEGTHNAGQ